MPLPPIPTKTLLGQEEMRRRTGGLGQRHRTILFLIDGRRAVSEVLSLALKAGAATSHFEDLVRMGYVELPPEEAPAPPPVDTAFAPTQTEITELALEVPAEPQPEGEPEPEPKPEPEPEPSFERRPEPAVPRPAPAAATPAAVPPAPPVPAAVPPPPPPPPPTVVAPVAPAARAVRAVPPTPPRESVVELPSRPFLPPSSRVPAPPPPSLPPEDLPLLEQARAQLIETLRCDPQPSSTRLAERVRLAKGSADLIEVVWVMERGLHHHQRSHRGMLALQRARELLGLGNTLVDEDSRPSRLEDEDW